MIFIKFNFSLRLSDAKKCFIGKKTPAFVQKCTIIKDIQKNKILDLISSKDDSHKEAFTIEYSIHGTICSNLQQQKGCS